MTVTDALKAAHDLLRKAVPGKRRKAKAELGVLAQTFTEAMEAWDRQKADGVPLQERVGYLERSLRSAWPQEREWKYLCPKCDDMGWVHGVCTPSTPCGRPFRLPQQGGDDWTGRGRCQPGHSYVTPCWCEKGQGFRRNLEKTKAPVSPEDFTQAGRSKPARIGR